jgi:hypothetical protein
MCCPRSFGNPATAQFLLRKSSQSLSSWIADDHMSDPTLNLDVLSMLAKQSESPVSAPVNLAAPVAHSAAAADDLNDSALAVIDQWTEKSEKEEAMDQWVGLNNIAQQPLVNSKKIYEIFPD